MRIAEDNQLAAEGFDRVRFTVQVVLRDTEAVPAPGIPVWQGARVDLANAAIGSHVAPPLCASN